MPVSLSGSLLITGSLTVTEGIIMSGSIASASYANNATSASYALNATTFNGLASSIFATTSSNTFVGNQIITGSVSIADSASVLQIVGNIFGQASLISPNGALVLTPGLYGVQINGAFPDLQVNGNVTSTGASSYLTGSLLGTASYATNANLLDGLDSTVFTSTSSFAAQTASFTAFTSSLNTFSASILSYTSSLNAKTSSFATTSSNTFIGTQIITGSLLQSGNYTTTGTITAQTINVQQVTSSIVYSCGSNNFGTAIGNAQVFTGSMFITGSNIVANVGNACFAGQVCAPTVVASTCLAVRAGSATSVVNNIAGAASNNHFAMQRNDAQYASIGLNGSDNFTIFGTSTSCPRLTIDGSGIASFASTICSPSFIGGTLSGTTIYGSTAVCSPVAIFSGCVGIGTTSPSTKLEVNSSDLNNIFVTNPDTTGTTTGSGIGFKAYNGTSVAQAAGIILTSNTWSFGTYSANQLSVGSDGTGGLALRTANAAPISFFTGCTTAGLSAERMRITCDGYVAVTGNQALKCVPYLQGMSFGWNRTNGQGESMINWTNAGGGSACDLVFNFRDSSTLYERLRIDSTGIVTINSTYFVPLKINTSYGQVGLEFQLNGTGFGGIGSANNFSSDAGIVATDVGMGTNGSATTKLAFATGAGYSTRMVILSGGNVGIGTTSPSDKLSVDGNISIGSTNKIYNGSSADSAGLYFSSNQVNISGYSGIIFRSSATNVTSQTEHMRITNEGKVSIGSTTPQTRAFVLGLAGGQLGTGGCGCSAYSGGGKPAISSYFGDQFGNGAPYGASAGTMTAYTVWFGGGAGGYFRGGDGDPSPGGGGAGIVAIGGDGSSYAASGAPYAEGGAGIYAKGGCNLVTGIRTWAGYFDGCIYASTIKGGNFISSTCTFSATSAGTNYDITGPGSGRWLASVNTNAVYHWNGVLALTFFDSADFGVNILTCGSYATAASVSIVNSGSSLRFCFSQNVGSVTVNYLAF